VFALEGLKRVLVDAGRYEEGLGLYEPALVLLRRGEGESLNSVIYRAFLHRRYGDPKDAVALYQQLIQAFARQAEEDEGPPDPRRYAAIYGLGLAYMAESRYADAVPLLREALEGFTSILGETHVETLQVLNNTARALELSGEIEEAERLHREVLDEAEPLHLEARRGVGGDDPTGTAAILYNLACLEAERGDLAKALDWLRQSVAAGLADADWTLQDPALAALHGPEFDELVDGARRNAAGQRAE
jgi:tetratricopeptide (TPR) repeat protein